jgi:hypothetical protein
LLGTKPQTCKVNINIAALGKMNKKAGEPDTFGPAFVRSFKPSSRGWRIPKKELL